MEVVTERLVLRPFREGDVDDVHLYASDPAVCFFTDWGPNSREESEAFVSDAVASGAPLNVAITLAADLLGASGTVSAGTVIGGLSAFGAFRGPVIDHPESRELGWVVRRDLWGQRIATEAVSAFVAWLAAAHGVREFTARCRPQNRSSSRVMEHVGMTYVERVPNDVVIHGTPADSEIYRLVVAR
ncbi:MAG: GNAT family N-acetyltransferase [Actinomycetota bacterium]